MENTKPLSEDTKPAEEGPTPEEVQSAHNVLGSFLLAIKNYGIYPEDHAISQKFLMSVKASLDPFLEQYGSLKIQVEKDGLLYRKVTIYQSSLGEEDHFASLLFRDGILWLEFKKGIEADEIATLFRIMHKNMLLKDEPEGDLATDLWEEHLKHIRYEAAEAYCESDAFDLSLMKVRDEGKDEDDTGEQEDDGGSDATESKSEDTDDTKGAKEKQRVAPDMTISKVNHASVQLTPQEQKLLKDYVTEEESRNIVEDVLDILLIVLVDQNQKEEFSAILEVIKEKFKDGLAQGELQSALNTLERMRDFYLTYIKEKSWRIPLLEDFFFSVSTPQILGELEPVFSHLESGNTDKIKLLRRILVLLPPEAIRVLGPMLLKIPYRDVQRQMLDVLVHLAKKDIRPLEDMLKHPNDRLVYRLVVVLGHLEGNKPVQLLLKMTRHYSERVRRGALTGLLKHDSHVLKRVFFLIEDPNPMIRSQIIEYLGRERNELSEDLLLQYLERKELGITGDLHIIACYRSLGLCGSTRSIPFLKQRLMGRAWSDMLSFRTSPQRKGAAIALAALGTEDAGKILKDASSSLSLGIRRAYKEAVERKK